MKICLTTSKGGLLEEVAAVAEILPGSHVLGILCVVDGGLGNKNLLTF